MQWFIYIYIHRLPRPPLPFMLDEHGGTVGQCVPLKEAARVDIYIIVSESRDPSLCSSRRVAVHYVVLDRG